MDSRRFGVIMQQVRLLYVAVGHPVLSFIWGSMTENETDL